MDEYKETQPIIYNLLKKQIEEDKISHAYLFDVKNINNYNNIIKSFVKEIMCPFNDKKCNNCNICSRIDSGNLLELMVINPDGLQIKKEQIVNVQENFSKKSIETKRMVYIINQCEKMNKQAANSILKFLEEPNDNITAILVTENIDKVLSTIVSRCQILKLSNNEIVNKGTSIENIKNKYYMQFDISDIDIYIENIYDKVKEFINFYYKNRIYTIIYLKKIWHSNFKNRLDNVFVINLLIDFHYDVLKYKQEKNNYLFESDKDLIKVVCNKTDTDNLLKKLELLIKIKQMINNNININLVIDYMIIKLERM